MHSAAMSGCRVTLHSLQESRTPAQKRQRRHPECGPESASSWSATSDPATTDSAARCSESPSSWHPIVHPAESCPDLNSRVSREALEEATADFPAISSIYDTIDNFRFSSSKTHYEPTLAVLLKRKNLVDARDSADKQGQFTISCDDRGWGPVFNQSDGKWYRLHFTAFVRDQNQSLVCVVPTVGKLTGEKRHRMLREQLAVHIRTDEGQKIKSMNPDLCAGYRTREECMKAEDGLRREVGRHVPVDPWPPESTPVLTADAMLHFIWILVWFGLGSNALDRAARCVRLDMVLFVLRRVEDYLVGRPVPEIGGLMKEYLDQARSMQPFSQWHSRYVGETDTLGNRLEDGERQSDSFLAHKRGGGPLSEKDKEWMVQYDREKQEKENARELLWLVKAREMKEKEEELRQVKAREMKEKVKEMKEKEEELRQVKAREMKKKAKEMKEKPRELHQNQVKQRGMCPPMAVPPPLCPPMAVPPPLWPPMAVPPMAVPPPMWHPPVHGLLSRPPPYMVFSSPRSQL